MLVTRFPLEGTVGVAAENVEIGKGVVQIIFSEKKLGRWLLEGQIHLVSIHFFTPYSCSYREKP